MGVDLFKGVLQIFTFPVANKKGVRHGVSKRLPVSSTGFIVTKRNIKLFFCLFYTLINRFQFWIVNTHNGGFREHGRQVLVNMQPLNRYVNDT